MRDKMYLCIWSADICSTMVVDGSDYDVDTSSASTQDVIPLKSLTASLWPVSHSDPCFLPTVKRLLFVKEL